MEPIEWTFTILSFIAYYFFISKKAGQANFRIIGLSLCLLIAFLTCLFLISIEVLSLLILNIISIIFNSYGIFNCYREIKANQKEENIIVSNEKNAEKLIKDYTIDFKRILLEKLNENLNIGGLDAG